MLSVILTSCPPDHAQKIADALVQQQVAACVQAIPGVRSTYRWQGAIQRDDETVLLIKTPCARVQACMAALQAVHPYEVPEMVEIPAGQVGAAYLAWAVGATERPG